MLFLLALNEFLVRLLKYYPRIENVCVVFSEKVFIVNFGHISRLFLVFLLLISKCWWEDAVFFNKRQNNNFVISRRRKSAG